MLPYLLTAIYMLSPTILPAFCALDKLELVKLLYRLNQILIPIPINQLDALSNPDNLSKCLIFRTPSITPVIIENEFSI